MKVIRKITCPLLNQLQLDHNYFKEEDGLAEGSYLPSIQIWVYFSENGQEKKNLNQRVNAKLHPLKLEQW